MKRDPLKAKLDGLARLRTAARTEVVPGVVAALADANAYVVAKAAAIAEERGLDDLIPPLLAAYDRFFPRPPEPVDDPNCTAKSAVAHALAAFEHREAEPFLRGLACVQMEPVWGKHVDTAGILRATCAHALVACDAERQAVLRALADHLVDADKATRIECVRALAQFGGPEVELVLRLKALAGDTPHDERGEVLGPCFAALLALEPERSTAFLRRFLDGADRTLRYEAASAFAQMRGPGGLAIAEAYLRTAAAPDERAGIAFAIAASPYEASVDLLERLRDDGVLAPADVAAALRASRFARDD